MNDEEDALGKIDRPAVGQQVNVLFNANEDESFYGFDQEGELFVIFLELP